MTAEPKAVVEVRIDMTALETKLDEAIACFKGKTPGSYTPMQFAELLQINVKTVYDGIHAGRIHAVAIGNQYRIPRGWAEEFLSGKGAAHA